MNLRTPPTALPQVCVLFVLLLCAPHVRAGETISFKVSGGPVMAGAFQEHYGTEDGHSTDASPSFGIQVNATLEFLGFMMVGTRFAWMDLQPDANTYLLEFPSGFAGLKTPSLGFLPELYATAGICLAEGRVGAEDDYNTEFDVFVLATVGVRYMLPSALPFSRWGAYLEATGYIQPVSPIGTLSVGVVWEAF